MRKLLPWDRLVVVSQKRYLRKFWFNYYQLAGVFSMKDKQENELDEQLQRLAKEAKQHPPKTPQRQGALAQLVQLILQSGRLCRPYRGQFEGVYEDIYKEAKQEMLLYICQKIDDYDPEKGPVMRWVNYLLKKRFFTDAAVKFMDKKIVKRTLEELENILQDEKEEGISLSELVIECIELDAEGIFKNEFIKNNPEANFQFLAKKRIAGSSWKEISLELGMRVSTVSSFYQRCLTKFAGKLREYCQNTEN